MRRKLAVFLTGAVLAVAGLVAVVAAPNATASTSAEATKAEATKAEEAKAAKDRGCKVSVLTDVVDHTTKVSGGASIYCPPPNDPANPFAMFVELYRNGKLVAADSEVCEPPSLGCAVAVDIVDSWDGRQNWRAKVVIRGSYQGTHWGNTLRH